MSAALAWLKYRAARALAMPRPVFYNDARYPRTVAGGWRYFREQVCSAEVRWYELRRATR